MRYPFIDSQTGQHSLRMLCRVMQVATSGFYAWRRLDRRLRGDENQRLLVEIKAVHAQSGGDYGSPRIYRALRKRGHSCIENCVARIMRHNSIRARTTKKFKVTTHSNHAMPVAENLLDRAFEVEMPNAVWTSDISYIWTREGWMYLAVVLDLFSRRVVDWAMHKRLQRQLVIDALEMAIGHRRPAPGLLHHSDRGSQYASAQYQRLLAKHGLIASMSRKGDGWDNAPTESFFSTLKRERVYHKTYRSRHEASTDIFNYIECWYNPYRLHSTLGYLSPAQFENQTTNDRKAA